MMQYLVCVKSSEGCDYSIGCGMRYNLVEAESREAVIESVVWPDGREEYSSVEGELALTEILIIPASDVVSVDIEGILADINTAAEEQQQQSITANELATLQMLKDKYENV